MKRTSSERNSSRHANASHYVLTVDQQWIHCRQVVDLLAEQGPHASRNHMLDNSACVAFSSWSTHCKLMGRSPSSFVDLSHK